MHSVPAQMEVLCRGVVDLHVRKELEERLGEGRPLRIKAGFDPTRPDLHLGHTLVLEKMRQFQDLGHTVIFLVGDYTAMVGDPTGKSEARPRLTHEEVLRASESYAAQCFQILDRDRTELRYNSEWLKQLDFFGIIQLGAQYTVARMLERDDFGKRYAEQRPIHVHEFLYPLLQAYDSVALECDVELGGTDQLFNLLVGRDVMPRYGKRPQLVLTTPLLEGTDARVVDGKITGQKMSKSYDNYVGIAEEPFVMLHKLMLVDDQVIWRYLELLSRRPMAEIEQLRRAPDTDIIAVKEAFAREIVERFHGAEAADAAFERRRTIRAGDVPADAPEIVIDAGGAEQIGLAVAIKQAQLAKSTGEALNLLKQGGVTLDGERVTDHKRQLARGSRYLVRVGGKNRRFAYLLVQ